MNAAYSNRQVWSLAPELIEAYRKQECYDIHVDMTLRCKGGCIFCFMSSQENSGDGLTTGQLLEIVRDVVEIGAQKITWYGGEPLLRADWQSIVEYAHGQGLLNDIRTGGQPFHRTEMAKRVVEMHNQGTLNEISFHIDSIDRSDFMRARRTYAEYYDEVIQGINNVIDAGYPKAKMSICIVQTKAIVNSFEKTVDWAVRQLGLPLQTLKLTSFRPCGFGQAHPELECTVDELRKNFEYVCQLHGWDVDKTPCLHECSKFYCATMVHIEGGGDVVPCSMMHQVVGNVNVERFRDIYLKNKDALLLKRLRSPDSLKGHCSVCSKSAICFGCRGNAYNYLHDATASDPKCWVNIASQ